MPEWRPHIRARLAGALPPAREPDVIEELAQHLDDRHAELVARGLSPLAAQAAALAELDAGDVLASRLRGLARSAPDPVIGAPGAGLWHDLRYAVRALVHQRGFTAVTLLSLALGIGANTAFFQFLVALQLRALPVAAPHELALVKIRDRSWGSGNFHSFHADLTNRLWEQIRDRQQAFSGTLAWGDRAFSLTAAGETNRVSALMVSGDYFRVLGVAAAHGRLLSVEDDRRGCRSGVVVSHGYWQSKLGGDPAVLSRTLELEGSALPIIGVTPPSFLGLEVGRAFDVFLPLCMEDALSGERSQLDVPYSWWLSVVGRLKPGWTVERATAQLDAISPSVFEQTVPPIFAPESVTKYKQYRLGAYPAATGISRLREQYTRPLVFLLAIAALVLLIACANLANLLLARASAREREIAVRLALGASRGRLLRQLMVESVLLASLGAGLGLVVARVVSEALMKFLRADVPLTLDWRVLGFTAGLAALTALLFGLAPALRASRADVGTVLQAAAGRSATMGAGRFGLRRLLVSGQVALSFVLLFGALLFVRSLRNVLTADPGFREEGLLTMGVDARAMKLPAERRAQFVHELLARLRATPGVASAAAASVIPIGGNTTERETWLEGKDSSKLNTYFSSVSTSYFETVGMRLVAGRQFTPLDGPNAPRVAIVNQEFARRHGQGGSVLGMRFRHRPDPGTTGERSFEIVGVVPDSKYESLREGPHAIAFVPVTQDDDAAPGARIIIRSDLPVAAVTQAVKRAVAEVAPAATVRLNVLSSVIRESTMRDRLMATLAGFFGLLAALLAAVGLYGVVSYSVARRTREIGIRMALGAGQRRVSRMILRETIEVLAAGLVAGVTLGLLAARTAGALLYGLAPHDLSTVILTAGLLASVALVASLVPARRAARIDPMVALREE